MDDQTKAAWQTPKLATLEIPRTLTGAGGTVEDDTRGFQEQDPPPES